MNADELAVAMNDLLRVREIEDYPNALNGLQVAGEGKITKVAAAVDACEAVMREAVDGGADLLLVHHGLFWSGLAPVTGAAYRKLKLAIENNLAVYSAHLPLDAHPELGNNALLADAIGLGKDRTRFLDIGWAVEERIVRDELVARVAAAVGGRVHLAPGGPSETRRIGIVSGGAGGEVAKAAAEVDTFITGEGPHWSYTAAEELGVNLLYAGHYVTETFGVKALAAHLGHAYGLDVKFLDHPTGL